MLITLLALSFLVVQIGMLIAFWSSFRKRDVASGAVVPVSVIVCAHDEEVNLRKLIPVLLAQDHPQFEVIVVEDRCNDGTYDYLLAQTAIHQNLKMVRVQKLPDHMNGKKFALTLGIKAASYDWVLLTDADCMPAGNQWIKSMSRMFSDDRQIVLGYSPNRIHPGFLQSFIRFEGHVTALQYLGWALMHSPYMGVGRNLAYRKSLFMSGKGFNRHLSVTGGDDDLFVNEHATATNTAVCITPESLIVTEPKHTIGDFLLQKKRHLAAGKFYAFKDKVRTGLFSLTWIASWIGLACIPFMPMPWNWVVGGAWFVRGFMLVSVLVRFQKRTGESTLNWQLVFLDFIYAIYYLGTGLAALFSRKIRWKN